MIATWRGRLRNFFFSMALVVLVGETIFQTAQAEPLSFWGFLGLSALAAFCSNFPVIFLQTEINLTHVVSVFILFTFGLNPALWAVTVGLGVGEVIRATWQGGYTNERSYWSTRLTRLMAEFVRQTLPLVIASVVYMALGEDYPVTTITSTTALQIGAFGLTHFVFYNFFIATELDELTSASEFFRANFLPLLATELLPVPFAALTASSRMLLGEIMSVAFGSSLALISASLNRLTSALVGRAQEIAALAAVGQEMTASLDLERLANLLIQRAMVATGATVGQLGLAAPDGQHLNFMAWHGGVPKQAKENLSAPWPIGRGLIGYAFRTGTIVRAGNMERDPQNANSLPGLRSLLCAPITREGNRLGVIVLASRQYNAFSREEEAFVRQLAVQASIGIDNARLYHDANTRLTEQSILYETGSALTATLERRAIYPIIAQQMLQAIAAAECIISDYLPQEDKVRTAWQYKPFAAGSGFVPASEEYVLKDFPVTARALRERVSFSVRSDNENSDRAERELLKSVGYGAMLGLPMVAADEVVGLVELFVTQPREFTENEIRLAQALSDQAAIALENARLFRSVAEGRDRLAAVLNSTREGILVIDANSVISLVNPPLEEMWGLPAKRLVGQSLTTLLEQTELDIATRLGFSRDDMLEMMMTLRAGLALGVPKIQYQITSPKPRMIERSGAPVLDQFSKAIGWVMVLRDVTEEKNAQEMREALVGMIVHDLRSPLTVVLGSLMLIRDRALTAETPSLLRQAVEAAQRSCNRLLSLLNTLLDVSRMETGEVSLQLGQFQISEIIDETLAEMMPLAAEQQIDMQNGSAPDLPLVTLDREKIGRVLMNLIDNALKFTPDRGQIRVCAEVITLASTHRSMLRCGVLDTGPGIPEDQRDKIFDRFAQVKGRKGRRAGTGLGLAFCKLATEAHGGKIWTENRAEGGSAFYFTLPIAEK